MKNLAKKTLLIIMTLLILVSTIKSLNASDEYTIVKTSPTTNKSLEVEFNKNLNINSGNINSDFKIYKDVKFKNISKDTIDTKKITIDIEWSFKPNYSYSILMISWSEWNIEFKTSNDFIWKEIKNDNLEDVQWIEKIIIKNEWSIDVYFLQWLVEENIDLKFYKDITIDKTIKSESPNNISILLKDKLENNSSYISTITMIQNESKKIDINNWIYDFKTNTLNVYSGELDEIKNEKSEEKIDDNDISLEDKLLNALEWTKIWDIADDMLWEENEIKEQLNSASDDPENKKQTQLEKFALSTEETPDTWATTWVLILGTFIINTFYFLSRRKKNKI